MAEEIVSKFPKEINTYYEPFCGGASITYYLLHTNIKIKNIICSDINKDLIDLWNEIKNNPQQLINNYINMWNELNQDNDLERKKKYFYTVRKRFNEQRMPSDFLFISRTTTNGLIRYNKSGEFNNSFHITRNGIMPNKLEKIISEWSKKIKNVQFINCDYKNIQTNEKDFLYLDPPYAGTKGMYYGVINYEELWEWLRKQKCPYILSFDGIRGNVNNTYSVPKELFTKHIYLSEKRSGFTTLQGKETEYVKESLYIS